jgi:hypothetical protein
MRITPLLLTIVVAAPSAVRSQEAMVRSWPVAAGSRVRVQTPAFGEEVGTAVSVTGDSLIFRAAEDTAYQPFRLAQLTKLDVSTGTHSTKAMEAAFGFLIGAGAGAIIGAWAYDRPTCGSSTQICIDIMGPGSRSGSAVLGGAILGLFGAAVGAIAGAHPSDTWVPVALPHSVRQ